MNSSFNAGTADGAANDPPARTVRALLDAALALGLGAIEARLLLEHAAGMRREQLIAFDERVIETESARKFDELVRARVTGTPIAYLIGAREFYGRSFQVAPGVLIPRPETELLVEFALTRAPRGGAVLDLGTGSGAIAVTLAAERPDLRVTACEISNAALTIAQKNNRALADGRVRMLRSDWFSALQAERFDCIVSNPPYVRAADPHLARGDVRFEPAGALVAGEDGLDAIRAIVARAGAHLGSGAWLAVEHGYDQAAAVRALLSENLFREVESRRDLAGIERISAGRRP